MLAAQIILSRLFSATIGYDYAFMLVSLAMLGLGAGGLIVQRAPEFFRAGRMGVQTSVLGMMMAVSAVAGVTTMVRVYVRLDGGESFWVLGALFWCFFPFFLSAGLLVAIVLGHAGERFHFYYGVDLTAAAAGCLAAVGILSVKSPVDAMLQGIAVMAMTAASLFALAHRHRRLAMVSLIATLGLVVVSQAVLPRGRFSDPLHLQFLRRAPVFSEWNSFSHVTVYEGQFFTWALSPRYQGPPHLMLDLLIDGMGGTEIVKFSGRPEDLAKYDYLAHDLTALGHALGPQAANRRQLIIGPGGGVDILQSYRAGWRDITVVEINPLVVRAVNVPDHGVGAFSGQPYHLPGVRLFVENARTFVKRSSEAWDLISLTWVDAGGSATAMAYSENYLYTVEAFREYLARVKPSGMLAFLRSLGVVPGELKIDSMRGIAVAAEALRSVGIARPERQVLVAAAESPFWPRPMCYVLVKNSPFTEEEIASAREFLTRLEFSPLWLPDGSLEVAAVPQRMRDSVVTIRELLTTSDPESLYQRSTLDLRPSTDDNPFYFMERAGPNRPAGASLLRLGTCLMILLVLVIPFLGLPLVPRPGVPRVPLDRSGLAALAYFSLLGAGFMLVEIEMFQVFALLLGSPTYALSVVLASLLVFSGLGSLSSRPLAAAPPMALGVAFSVLVVLLGSFALFHKPLLAVLLILPFPLRVAATVSVIAPLAFCMGLPLATGMRLVKDRPDLILWGWALNGVFSVLSGVGAIFMAMHVGISRTFAIGMVCYLAAALLIQQFRRRPPSLAT